MELRPEAPEASPDPIPHPAGLARVAYKEEVAFFRTMKELTLVGFYTSGAGAAPEPRYEQVPGRCIHEMGSARMGRDPGTSVRNGNNQAHEVKNLFVTDGARMSSSASQDPSITYTALTARACDVAVREMKRGNP